MRFLHVYIHRHDYTRLIRARAAADVLPIDPPEVLCPGCQAPYYLDDATSAIGLRAQRRLKQEGRARLRQECPDHSHQFEVEEW